MVLDGEGLSKPATDRAVFVDLEQALRRRARVVVSAAVLAEVIRGHRRDAAVNRIVAKVTVLPVTEATGRLAGQLLGKANLGRGHAVDAMVAATAVIAERPVLILTSDQTNLTTLVADTAGIAVTHA
ncbi:MAG: PIN domain-containing protein [Pseudonocardiales bacterium]